MNEEKNIPGESRKSQAASDNPDELAIGNKQIDKNPDTTSQSKPETISQPEPQPTNMEVHKPPRHVMHKKKWSEYLLEFLMLFLAVFLGFIAENQNPDNE